MIGLSFATLIHSLELLCLPIFSRDLVCSSHRTNVLRLRVFRSKGWLISTSIVSLSLILTVIFKQTTTSDYLLIFLALLNLGTYSSRSIGRDGADQLRSICLIILALTVIIPEPLQQNVAASFIGLQVLIAYFTSGIAKLMSPIWRKGDILAQILNNYTYGSRTISKLLQDNRRLNQFFSFAPIALMTTTSIAFFIPYPEVFYLLLLGMFIFHLSTAILMGLNDFALTFPATFPCLILFHSIFQDFAFA